MSTAGTDGKMARSSSFVGTLKRLFKTSHRSEGGSEGPRTGGANLPVEALAKASQVGGRDMERMSYDSTTAQTLGGNEGASSPFSSRKSVERQLHASSSGPLMSSSFRSASIAQASLHHSISDTCENPTIRVNLNRPADDGGWPADPQKPAFPSSARGLRGSSLKIAARYSDTSLPALCEVPSRSCSLDIQTVGSPSLGSSPKPFQRSAVPVSLPSVEPPSYGRLSGAQVPVLQDGAEGPTAPMPEAPAPPPPPPSTTLLALCPGAPAAMRRRQWSLEDFEVTRRIYKGATSAVYKATCRRSGVAVALKVYSLSRVPPNVIHMIVREIKIHTDLVHKHVAMLYAAFQDEKRLVLVQEYAGRGDLYGIYRSLNRRMSETQLTCLVLGPFMEALSYLHSRGICHRDIKPENILFTNDWRLLIADFGVSIDLNQERAVTRAGTLEYMAPEVERCPLKMLPEENKENDALAYTTAVDIWATGVLAYELMVGFPPFVVDNAPGSAAGGGSTAGGSFLAEHATRRTLSFPASTSPHAQDFIRQALAERPEERPTAVQLSRHPWLAAAMQQPTPRRSASQINSLNGTPLFPSRLGSASLASAPNTSTVSPVALVL